MTVTTDSVALPEALKHLAGTIMDPDTHEQMPAQVWASEIVPAGAISG